MKYKLFKYIQTFALWLIRSTTTNSGSIKHFNNEIVRAKWVDDAGNYKDEMQELACKNVLDLLAVLSTQGHSGWSVSYVTQLFTQCVKYKPLCSLTGSDDEWIDVGDNKYQNKCLGSVFKHGKEGKAYWLDFYVFKDQNGCTFTNSRSRQFIEFPWYPPESIVVEITDDEEGNHIYPDYIKPIVLD